MKFRFFALLLSSIALTNCGGKEPATTVRTYLNYDLSDTISVLGNSVEPADSSKQVSIHAPIRVKFSGPISTYSHSINPDTFRVEADGGGQVEGIYQFNSAGDEVTFVPHSYGMPAALSLATDYTVYVEFVLDQSQHLVAPFSWRFRTKDFTDGQGNFRVSAIYPSNFFVMTNRGLDVEFNKPIAIPRGMGPNTCSDVAFSEVFQVIAGYYQNGGNIEPIPGYVCIVCDRTSGQNVCNTLEFVPYQYFPTGILTLIVNPTDSFRSTEGHKLNEGTTEVKFAISF